MSDFNDNFKELIFDYVEDVKNALINMAEARACFERVLKEAEECGLNKNAIQTLAELLLVPGSEEYMRKDMVSIIAYARLFNLNLISDGEE